MRYLCKLLAHIGGNWNSVLFHDLHLILPWEMPICTMTETHESIVLIEHTPVRHFYAFLANCDWQLGPALNGS